MGMWLCKCECLCLKRTKVLDPAGTGIMCYLIWVLGLKLESSWTTVCVLNLWTISPTKYKFCKIVLLFQCNQLILINHNIKEWHNWNITYIIMAFKDIWWTGSEDFISFQTNYSFTNIWFWITWTFCNYNVTSERGKKGKEVSVLLPRTHRTALIIS